MTVAELVLAVSGLLVLVGIVRRHRAGRPLLHAVERPFRPVPPAVPLSLAAGLFLAYQLAQVAGYAIGGAAGGALGAFLPLAAALLAAVVARRAVLLPRGSLAWRVGVGLLLLWAALPVVYGTYLVCMQFGTEQPQIDVLRQRETGWSWLALTAVLAAPVAEEVCFRGLLYPALRQRYRAAPAIVLSSLAFAFVHPTPTVWLPLFLLAVVLAWLVETTGSIAPTIAAHMAFNGLTVVALLLGV